MNESGAGGPDVELVSPLPLERCRGLLAARIDSGWNILGRRPVIGRMSGTTLQACKRTWYDNGSEVWVAAELVEQAGRTHVRCRFSVHRTWSNKGSLAGSCWAASLGAGALLVRHLFLLVAHPSEVPKDSLAGLVLPVATLLPLLLALGLARIERWAARNERRFLLGFLRDTLDAVPAPGTHPHGQAAAHRR